MVWRSDKNIKWITSAGKIRNQTWIFTESKVSEKSRLWHITNPWNHAPNITINCPLNMYGDLTDFQYSPVLQYSETSWLQERSITLSGVHSRTPSYKLQNHEKKRNQLSVNWVSHHIAIEDRKFYNSLRKENIALTRIAGRLALRDSLLAYRRSKNSRTSAQRPKG